MPQPFPNDLDKLVARVQKELDGWERSYADRGARVTRVEARREDTGEVVVLIGVTHNDVDGERLLDLRLSARKSRPSGSSDAAMTLGISLFEIVGQDKVGDLPPWPAE